MFVKIDFKRYIASEIAGIIGAGISAVASLAGTHMRNEAQKREQELAYRRERQQINEQNAYNSASAQMARLQAAGLNPNMMYDNGQQAAAGLQEDIARYQPANLDNAVDPLGNAGAQMIQNIVGLREMENKTALANAEILTQASTREVNTGNLRLANAQADRILGLLGWELKEKEVGIEATKQNIAKAKSDIELNDKNIEALNAKIHLSRAEIDNLDAKTKQILMLAPSQKEYLVATARERQKMVENIDLQMRLAKQANVREWIHVGVSSVAEIATVLQKFLGKGASLADGFSVNPFERNLSPDFTAPDNDIMDFLPGD